MKLPVLLVSMFLPGSVRSELIAHFHTDKGQIDVTLLYDKAPQAVANFITLVEGTRAHLDPDTGALSTEPYYIGETFFRVVNDPTFKIAQTGSGTGTNSGGPGFAFRDEFDDSLTHEPYVLSMANSGPNTNGSQIFFTGSVAAPGLDGVHTVFGLVPEGPGRAVIDAIHGTGSNGSSITNVTFSRTDPAAEAFDELAQNLPTVSSRSPSLEITRGSSVTALFAPPLEPGDRYDISWAPDLANSWEDLVDGFIGYDNGPSSSLLIDDGSLSRAFYQATVVSHPDSPTPASIASRVFKADQPDSSYSFTFNFSADGSGGVSSYTGNDSSGSIVTLIYQPGGYGALLIVDADHLVPLRFQLAFDESDETELKGRHSMSSWNAGQWSPAGSATFTLTR